MLRKKRLVSIVRQRLDPLFRDFWNGSHGPINIAVEGAVRSLSPVHVVGCFGFWGGSSSRAIDCLKEDGGPCFLALAAEE